MNVNDTTRHVQPYPSPVNKTKPVLRAHRRAFLLLFFYIPLVVVPWIITLVMVYRPLTRPSWIHASGFWQKDYKIMKGWATAIPIMNACAAVIAISVTSAVVAQAAVVFAQRRHAGQHLSVRHLFSLADRVWCDLGALPHTVAKANAAFKCFVLGATAVVILGAVQYPLIQIFVSWKEINIPNCSSTGYIQELEYGNFRCDARTEMLRGGNYHQLGIDLEPAQLAIVPASSIMPRIKTELSQYRSQTTLEHLWQERSESRGRPAANMQNLAEAGFVTVLPADSTTGILRQHLMRMNSNVTCTNLTLSEFPSTCTGTKPFQGSWDYVNYYTSYNGTLDICAPGDTAKHPWTLSRNRQDITEDLFFKYREEYYPGRFGDTMIKEEVFHCKAETTRGYFELGNVYNGEQYGPLLDKWPSNGSTSQYHDYFTGEWGSAVTPTRGYFLSEEDDAEGAATAIPDRVGRFDYYAPNTYTNVTGPLMTSVLALFGPDSWTNAVVNITAGKSKTELGNSHTTLQALLTPLCRLTPYRRGAGTVHSYYQEYLCTENLDGLRVTLDNFLAEWSTFTETAAKLRAGMFIANRALLTANAGDDGPWQAWTGREIYTAPGWTVLRPHIPLPVQIILSFIIALHVLGLLALAFLIYRYPAWTRTLDTLAVARVAASLDATLLPPMRAATHKDSVPLASIDGLIGAQENEQEREPPVPRRRHRSAESGVLTNQDIEMDALSVASTAGKEPASNAVPTPAYDERLILALGAPGVLPRRVRVDKLPPNPPPVPPPVPQRMQVQNRV